jgi:hypothetical protein
MLGNGPVGSVVGGGMLIGCMSLRSMLVGGVSLRSTLVSGMSLRSVVVGGVFFGGFRVVRFGLMMLVARVPDLLGRLLRQSRQGRHDVRRQDDRYAGQKG